MLRLSSTYLNRAILSLRTGGRIGLAVEPVINPNNLKIEAWYAQSNLEKGMHILPAPEIRDVITKGLVVNDHDALTPPEDMVRLKETIALNFQLVGKPVVSEQNKRLGRVTDYSVDDSSFYIQKLYVSPPLLRGLTTEQLLVDRTQIVEITAKKIIVSDPTVKATSGSVVTAFDPQ